MKIVVTGATGFLGRPLCSLLLAQGHEVTALSRNADHAATLLEPAIECLTWSVGSAPGAPWETAVAYADAVIHLAGQPVAEKVWTPEIKEALRRSRIDTTRRLVDAMRNTGGCPKVLVSASGINYYGDGGEAVLTEASPPGSTFLAQLCVDWEAEACKAEAFGVRVVCCRAGIVLEHGGPLDKLLFPLPVPISPWALGLGGPIGNGRQWMPWIHRDDAVGILHWSVMTASVSGAVNTVAPQLIRNSEFSRALGRTLHRLAILPIPPFVLKALVGGFADELLTSQRAEPGAAIQHGYPFEYPGIEACLAAILAKGLR